MLSEAIVLARLELKLVLDLAQTAIGHVELCLQVLLFAVLLLDQLFEAVDLHLADVNLVLVLRILNLGSLMELFLASGHTVKLHAHVLDLLSLSMIDVGLSRDIAVALLDLGLSVLKLLSDVALGLLRLGKLDLDVAERIFQLLVLNLAQAKHLAVFDLCAFLCFDTQAATYDSISLKKLNESLKLDKIHMRLMGRMRECATYS